MQILVQGEGKGAQGCLFWINTNVDPNLHICKTYTLRTMLQVSFQQALLLFYLCLFELLHFLFLPVLRSLSMIGTANKNKTSLHVRLHQMQIAHCWLEPYSITLSLIISIPPGQRSWRRSCPEMPLVTSKGHLQGLWFSTGQTSLMICVHTFTTLNNIKITMIMSTLVWSPTSSLMLAKISSLIWLWPNSFLKVALVNNIL